MTNGRDIERELRKQKQERDGAKDSTGMSTALVEALVAQLIVAELSHEADDLVQRYAGPIRASLGVDLTDRRIKEIILGAQQSKGNRVRLGTFGIWHTDEAELAKAEAGLLAKLAEEAATEHAAFVTSKRKAGESGGRKRDERVMGLRDELVRANGTAKNPAKRLSDVNEAIESKGFSPIGARLMRMILQKK